MNSNKTEISPAQAGTSGEPNDQTHPHSGRGEKPEGFRAARLSPDWFKARFWADCALEPHSSPLILKFIGEVNAEYDLKYRFDIECKSTGTKTFRVTRDYLKALHYQIGECLKGDVCVNPYS